MGWRSRCASPVVCYLLRKQDRVDDVNDTVTRGDICLDDIGGSDRDFTPIHLDRGFLSVHGLGAHGLDIRSHYFAGDYVVGEDAGELFLVLGFEKALDGSSRQLGEGFVRGCEYSERTFAAQGFRESSRFHGSHQSFELAGTGSYFDDVFRIGGAEGVDGQGESRGECRGNKDEFFHELGLVSVCCCSGAAIRFRGRDNGRRTGMGACYWFLIYPRHASAPARQTLGGAQRAFAAQTLRTCAA